MNDILKPRPKPKLVSCEVRCIQVCIQTVNRYSLLAMKCSSGNLYDFSMGQDLRCFEDGKYKLLVEKENHKTGDLPKRGSNLPTGKGERVNKKHWRLEDWGFEKRIQMKLTEQLQRSRQVIIALIVASLYIVFWSRMIHQWWLFQFPL